MSKNFQPLSSGEVLSIDSGSHFVIGHSTFRVDEFTAALKQLLLEQGLGGITDETIDWVTDDGIECDVLRFGASGWVKGKVRLHLEFAEEGDEASADPKPKAATDVLLSVAAHEIASPTTSTVESAVTPAELDEWDLDFDEELSLDLDDSEAASNELSLPDMGLSQPKAFTRTLDDSSDFNLATSSPEVAANLAETDNSEDFEAFFEDESEVATPAAEIEADFDAETDDLNDLFGEEDADFDVLVAAESATAAVESTDDLDSLFNEEMSSFDGIFDELPEEAIAPPEPTDIAMDFEENHPEPSVAPLEDIDVPAPLGKETIISHDTLVQPDETSLEELFGEAPSAEPSDPPVQAENALASDMEDEALFDEDISLDEIDAEISDEHLEDLFEAENELTEDLFGTSDPEEDLFGNPDAEDNLSEFELDLDLEDLPDDDDEPTAITTEVFDLEEEESLDELFEAEAANTSAEDVFDSLLEDGSANTFDDLEDLDLDFPEVSSNPFGDLGETSTLPDSGSLDTLDNTEDPFATFTAEEEATIDELSGELGLSLEENDQTFDDVDEDDLGFDDLFEETETPKTESQSPSSKAEDLGEFINVTMFRKKQ
ncbi:KGK domain-containing protein [Picosynechococcus sp. NKBG15041c]|uniref:KGK domain-containing protein n=1 Tax=Picosynechococcus sp. NKBG15041c TaxID=1407650 RepID=UPI00040C7F1F|nr:KGK domain-containing protein [Picosynechococcus sp. NKBG15041c]